MLRPTENQHFTCPKGRLIFSLLPFKAREERTKNQTQCAFLTGLINVCFALMEWTIESLQMG